MGENKCHSCDNRFRGSRGLNLNVRRDQTCAKFYASRVDSTDALLALGGSLAFAYNLAGGDLLDHGSCASYPARLAPEVHSDNDNVGNFVHVTMKRLRRAHFVLSHHWFARPQ